MTACCRSSAPSPNLLRYLRQSLRDGAQHGYIRRKSSIRSSCRHNSSIRASSSKTPSTRPPTAPQRPAKPPPAKQPPQPSPSRSRSLVPALLTATQLILTYHLISSYIYELSACEGPSMVPTLSAKGDWILINKFSYRRGRHIRVGDVGDFAHPVIPGVGAVKRVVGMPGDFVIVPSTSPTSEGDHPAMMMQVPDGHCWLLGDNLAESRDSRTYGPVPLALIKGKVVARVLPMGEAKWIGNNVVPV